MFHYLQIKRILILVYHWNEMGTVLQEDKCDVTLYNCEIIETIRLFILELYILFSDNLKPKMTTCNLIIKIILICTKKIKIDH